MTARAEPSTVEVAVGVEQLGRLIDNLDDRLRLRQRLTDLGTAAPFARSVDPARLEEDLVEGLRLCRASVRRPNSRAERRYRLLELLIVERMSTEEAAAALYCARRSAYRLRREGLEELALTLDGLWRQRHALDSMAPGSGDDAVAVEFNPKPSVFLGRQQELSRALVLLERHRLLVIGGPAGIGKTVLGAVVAKHLAAQRPVLWLRFRAGLTDSIGGVFHATAERLAELGAGSLKTFLQEVVPASPWQPVAYSLAVHSLNQHRLALVIDDGDVIARNREVCGLLSSLHAECPESLIVVMGREGIPALESGVRLELAGLDLEAAAAHLRVNGLGSLTEADIQTLHHETGGNPHLLNLAAGAILHGQLDADRLGELLLEVPDVRAYFFDHIFGQLSDGQRLVLCASALMRQPASASFLATALDSLTPGIPAKLAELGRRFLLTSSSDGLRIHSTVREFVRRTIGPAEGGRLHSRLAAAYERAGRHDEACHHWLEAGQHDRAKAALLANRPDTQPHVHAQLTSLLEALEAAGLADDPELSRFRRTLDRRVRPQPDAGAG